MKVNEYKLLDHAVGVGIEIGYARAHKHTDKPDEQAIKDSIHQAVMNELCDWFIFEKEEES